MLAQMEVYASSTPLESLQQPLAGVLASLAERAVQASQPALARALYTWLQDHHLGTFAHQLAELDADQDVEAYVELAQEAQDEERWILWQDAWTKHPGHPQLREAIQQAVETSQATVMRKMEEHRLRGDLPAALALYRAWLQGVDPLAEAWQEGTCGERIAARAWQVFRGVMAAIHEVTAAERPGLYEYALEVVAPLPLSAYSDAPVDNYLLTVRHCAEILAAQAEVVAAVELIDYSCHLSAQYPGQVSNRLAYRIHKYAGELCDQIGYTQRAHEHFRQAHHAGSIEQQASLKQRLYVLNEDLRGQKGTRPEQLSPAAADVLLESPAFRRWVNSRLFDAWVRARAKSP
jgi:hypothetical protein